MELGMVMGIQKGMENFIVMILLKMKNLNQEILVEAMCFFGILHQGQGYRIQLKSKDQ